MEEHQNRDLIGELECIFKDSQIIVHVLDFGFLSKESVKLCGVFSTFLFDKSSGLIKFEDETGECDYIFDSSTNSNLRNIKKVGSYKNEFVATLLISNNKIINLQNNFGESFAKYDEGRTHSESLKVPSFGDSKDLDFGINAEKIGFKGVEVEISINNLYPTSPFRVYYSSFYNIKKSDREKIKLSSKEYFSNNNDKIYSISDFINIIKTKLHSITKNEEIRLPMCNNLCNIEFNDISEKFKERDEYIQTNDLEGDSYRLCSGRFEDNFEVIKVLGFGGFGSVFMVREKFGGQCVYAIKQIPLSSKNKHENQILINEAAMLACLNHEKIVRYYHAWVQEPVDDNNIYIKNDLLDRSLCSSFAPELLSQFSAITARYITNEYLQVNVNDMKGVKEEKEENIRRSIYLYIQMEYCSGYSLQFAIDQGLLINNNKLIWDIFYQIIQGLSYLHGKGVIHRDLKPSNIFLQLENSQNHNLDENWYMVKLGDFGLTTFVNMFEDSSPDNNNLNSFERSKKLSSGVGTLFYMAPEQSEGNNYNQSADMFSLGVILFEMHYPPFITGMERVKILSQLTTHKSFPTNSNIPPNVQSLIKSLLSDDPNKRPTSNQLLYNEWILKQAKLYLQVRETNKSSSKDLVSEGKSSEYCSVKICDIISRNPHIHENNQILDTLFSLENRLLDKINFQSKTNLSYLLFRTNTYVFKGSDLSSNSLVIIHNYYKKRLELITFIKNIFRTHDAIEVEIPILIPKNNNKNIRIDETTQYEINENDNNISIKDDYLIFLGGDKNHNSPQVKNKKFKKNKKIPQNKVKSEVSEDISPFENPLTVLLLEKTGIPLILCNSILKNMSVQLGDGQGIRPGAVIKRFCVDSIYTQDNFINTVSNNNMEILVNAHPKEILMGAYEIVVKINDRIGEEFEDYSFVELPKSNYSVNSNINIFPLWYYNFAVYYDVEIVITAINTLKPYELLFGRPIFVWGDSQLFITLLESWIGIKYDKAKHLQLWLQSMIPKGFSKRKFFNILQNITFTSLAEYANCYGCFDIENEDSDSADVDISDQIVAYYLGLKILSYPSILEKVVECILYIIDDFKGLIKDLVNIINKGAFELFNLFENEKKKFIITCKNEYYKRIAKTVRYPLHLNLINNKNTTYNISKYNDKFYNPKYLFKDEFEINHKFITPNLFKVLYRISLFNKLLRNVNLVVSQSYFDPMLFSSSNFFESGFFFYLFSREINSEQYNQPQSVNKNLNELRNNPTHSICKVGCIMDLIFENRQNSNTSQVITKKTNIILLVKGGRFDNWFIDTNNNNVIFYKNTNINNGSEIVSAVGFEIILERILFKLLIMFKYRKFIPKILNQQATNDIASNFCVSVFIYNNIVNSKFQRKAVKLKQMLLLNGINCQRNINYSGNNSNSTDIAKLKSSIRNKFPSLNWIVYILRANTSETRKIIANNEVNSSINGSCSTDFQTQSNTLEIKYKLECCSSENQIVILAKESISNHSFSSNSKFCSTISR
ncbi:Ser/thr protein kinase [Cryptosporidium ryanae]|uniref:Ser/thr protein kinase n=1 Tax=Cryptosporidium ryanae TaxID=515981 RepID=UPI00351A5263|nr:Ser/thr protein kinase [Cryptosporidium ryanae]